nr:DUF2256 domain-containing protein [Pseudoalteromonas sp. MM17-2]
MAKVGKITVAHKKVNLPYKYCPVCGLRFTWRKKWRNNWPSVRYCSKRCAAKGVS